MVFEKKILVQTEEYLFEKAKDMKIPIFDHDLGVIVYFASLFSYTQQNTYKEKTLKLYNKAIEVYSNYDFGYSLVEGFEGIFWVVNHLKKCGIIENENILINLKPYLIESIEYDLKTYNYNLLHGCLGKLQYLVFSDETDKKETLILVDKVIDSLYENRIEKDGFLNWEDSNFKELFNIRFFNGHTSLLNFFLQLKYQGYENDKNEYLINKLLEILISSIGESKVLFIRGIAQEEGESKYFNLAEYHGNLIMAFTLYFAGIVLDRTDLKLLSKKLTLEVCVKDIKESGIIYFENEDFYDISISNGLAGIPFLLFRLNNWIGDSIIEESLNKWTAELTINTLKVFHIEEKLMMPKFIQNKKGNYYYDKNTFFEGILGAGLVLSSIFYGEDNWSNYLGFYE